MINNPSCYRSIYKQEERGLFQIKYLIMRLAKRHLLKLFVCIAVFILLFTSFLMMSTDASSNQLLATSEHESVITISSGDTLWKIAKKQGLVSGQDDIQYIIYLIKDRNNMKSSNITAGQQLVIPNIR